jgi:hypothetical protein
MNRRAVRRIAALVVVVFLASACSGLEFVQDRRLSFTAPASNHLTKLPVTLRWTMKNAGASGEYVVFIDKTPLKVGQTLRSLMPSGVAPTAALLANINVYATQTNAVTVTLVPDIGSDHGSTRQRHTATIVLVDAQGKRTSESSWSRSFDLKKAGS